MKGRKPIPVRIKRLTGNPGKRKVPPEPALAGGGATAPSHLTGPAKSEWKRVVKALLTAGLYKAVDRAALAAYCQAYARWREAEKRLTETPMVMKSPSGYAMQNPYLSIANKALEQMKAFMTEFGMTPSSRARVGMITDAAVTRDEFELFKANAG